MNPPAVREPGATIASDGEPVIVAAGPVASESSSATALHGARVTLGAWLGKGGFSNVYAVACLEWKDDAGLNAAFHQKIAECSWNKTPLPEYQHPQDATACTAADATAERTATSHSRRRSLVGFFLSKSSTAAVPAAAAAAAAAATTTDGTILSNSASSSPNRHHRRNTHPVLMPLLDRNASSSTAPEQDLSLPLVDMDVQLQDFNWQRPLPATAATCTLADTTTPFVLKLLRPELLLACQQKKSDHHDDDGDESTSSASSLSSLQRYQHQQAHAHDVLALAQKDLRVEAQILSQCDHPHILPLRSVGMDTITQQPLLVLDRIDTTLRQYLDQAMQQQQQEQIKTSGHHQRAKSWFVGSTKRPLFNYSTWDNHCSSNDNAVSSWRLRLLYAQQLASALAYLHQRHILYRDVKPDNVGLVTTTTASTAVAGHSHSSVQLLDFGLARIVTSRDRTRHDPNLFHLTGLTGSAKYMAPEVGMEQPYNAACDVYSFAILLWEVVTLQTPFPKMNLHKLFQQVYHGPKIRPSLDEVEKAIHRSYATKAMAAAALQTIQTLLAHCWDGDWAKRYSMERMESLLRQESKRAAPAFQTIAIPTTTTATPTPSAPTIGRRSPQSQPNNKFCNNKRLPSEQELQAMAHEWSLAESTNSSP